MSECICGVLPGTVLLSHGAGCPKRKAPKIHEQLSVCRGCHGARAAGFAAGRKAERVALADFVVKHGIDGYGEGGRFVTAALFAELIKGGIGEGEKP